MHKNDAPIAQLCPKRWHEMHGRDSVRLCASCQNHVYNLSDMTDAAARRFVEAPPEHACIIYDHDSSGEILHRPVVSDHVQPGIKKLLQAAFAVLAFFPVQTACGGMPNDSFEGERRPQRTHPWEPDCSLYDDPYIDPSCPSQDQPRDNSIPSDMAPSIVDMALANQSKDTDASRDLDMQPVEDLRPQKDMKYSDMSAEQSIDMETSDAGD